MQSPVSQTIQGQNFELRFSNFILQTPAQDIVPFFTNSVRALSTILQGDPVLAIPSSYSSKPSCKVQVRIQPSMVIQVAAPYNLTCDISSFGKVSPVNPAGIVADGQTLNVSLLGSVDSFILPVVPSILDFTAVFGYFVANAAYNSATYPITAGVLHRYQAIVDITLSGVWRS